MFLLPLQELSNNIISHQADLRFLSMAVSKYMEEVKVRTLNILYFNITTVIICVLI